MSVFIYKMRFLQLLSSTGTHKLPSLGVGN